MNKEVLWNGNISSWKKITKFPLEMTIKSVYKQAKGNEDSKYLF